MSLVRYQVLVFDWDGTLIDSEGRIVDAMQCAAAQLRLPVPSQPEVSEIIGLGLKEALSRLFPHSDGVTQEQLIATYRDHFMIHSKIESPLFDNVEKTLQSLINVGYRLAIATGKGRRGLDHALRETALSQYFHASRCADETASKPNPQMLNELMAELGAKANEMLMIGDTEYDMEMAQLAGADSLAVSYGVHALARLQRFAPAGYIDAIDELPTWLKRQAS